MAETPRDPGRDPVDPVPPAEPVEKHEYVERTGPAGVPREERVEVHESRTVSPWLWLLPLLIIVAVLIWFVLTRGEPIEPRDVDLGAPQIEAPAVERRIEVTVPAQDPPPPAEPEPEQPDPL